jgi:hypothetical protein
MWAGFVLGVFVSLGAVLEIPERAAPPQTCPSDVEVEAELARLGAGRSMRPEIVIEGSRMRVVLRAQDGSMVGSREVEAPVACHERATVAAVLVATWMGIWPAGESGTKPAPPSPAVIASPKPLSPAAASTAEIGLAIEGAHDGNAAALGLALSASRALWAGVRVFAAASATTERDRSVGLGTAGYLRPTLEAGPALRLGRGVVSGEIGLSGRLGLLILRGKDLPVTRSATHVTPGVGGYVRLHVGRKSFVPFAFVSGAYWLAEQTLTLEGTATRADLPRWDATAGVGVLWAPGR